MFEQSEDEQLPCVMCGQHNEQMLMLGCQHDPCINCASIHYTENQPYNSAIYICAKCGQETELDPSSVLQLQRVYTEQKGKKRFNYPRNVSNSNKRSKEPQDTDESRRYPKTRAYEPVQPPSRTVNQSKRILKKAEFETKPAPNISNYYAPQPVSKPSYFSNPKNANYKSMYPCKDHAEEQLTYFCFSCCKPICPECAIHGSHKDHEVETTRKAIKKIRSLLNERRQNIEAEATNLLNQNQKGKKQQKQYAENTLKDKDYIKQKISHLRNVLTEKEKQLLKQADENFNRNCEIIKMKNAAADSALNKITNCRKNIENTLKLEELAILQEFNKRDQEANTTLQKLTQEREKQEEYQLKYPPLSLDFDQFQDQLDRFLENIHSLKLTSIQTKR